MAEERARRAEREKTKSCESWVSILDSLELDAPSKCGELKENEMRMEEVKKSTPRSSYPHFLSKKCHKQSEFEFESSARSPPFFSLFSAV